MTSECVGSDEREVDGAVAMAGGDDGEARLILSHVVEPGDDRVAQMIHEMGADGALALLRRGPAPGVTPSNVAWQTMYATRLSEMTSRHRSRAGGVPGLRFVVPGDPEWPAGLDDLGTRAPIGLWLRGAGRLDRMPDRIAIVGSRASTEYGQHMASDLAAGLAERGWTVVSGGAYGIDAAAHRGALAVDGATVAVLACGLDIAYPQGNESLFGQVMGTGVTVSEHPPGEHPTRSRFLRRNLIIAAMTAGTLVVEAAVRSGATSTVNHAIGLNRPTMGVPGPVTSPSSAGVHQLIRDAQAVLITDVDEILELLSESGVGLLECRRGPIRAHDTLDPVDRQILDGLRPRKPTSSDTVADRLGLSAADVLVRLSRLDVAGLADLVEGGWVVRVPPIGSPMRTVGREGG